MIHLLHGAFACALCSLLTDFKSICLGNCCCRVSASKTSDGQFVTSNSLVQPYIPKRFETRLLPSMPRNSITLLSFLLQRANSATRDVTIQPSLAKKLPLLHSFQSFVRKVFNALNFFLCAHRIFRLCLSTDSA